VVHLNFQRMNFSKTGCLLILLLAAVAGFSQSIIKGRITDNRGKAVSGANITLKDTYDGATSDSLGRYSFRTSEKGSRIITVSCIGYRSYSQEIKLIGGAMEINISIREEVTELNAVVITAGTFEASDRKRATAVLDPIDIVTTASANGDITGALKTLPGAQQVGESEGLYVRGGTAGETKTFIDGTLVNNFFYSSVPNIAQFSRFSPFIFKGTVFSTGGYSALYGQALSSALILESIDLPERSSASLGITVLSLSGGYQQLAKDKKSSWGGSYNYTNLAPAFVVIKQKQDYSTAPTYHTGDANFRIKTSKTGILKYYAYFNANKLSFTSPSIDTLGYLDRFAISNNNFYHNLSWRENLGSKWKINMGISYTYNKDEINGSLQDMEKNDVSLNGLEDKTFAVNSKGNYFNGKLVLEKKLRGLSSMRFGGEYNYFDDRSLYTRYTGESYPGNIKQHVSSLFSEADIYITNVIAARIGGRFEYASLINKMNLAPRLSLAYKLGKGTQASLAYGIFFQNPERRYLPSDRSLSFMKATHYIGQFQKIANQQTFRAEIFYKEYDELIKTGFVGNRETAINNKGFGNAKGIEFFWRDKKTIKNLDYWISYSYLDTKRDFLNFPYAITPNFAARHTASFIVKKFVQPWKMNLNGSYNFSSGRPYYDIRIDGADFKFNDRGVIPDYHNVSFSINYLPFIGKKNPKSYAVWVLQVSNLLNIRQTFGYTYSYNGLRKEAIVPPSRMFVFIGVFISFGVDRSDEIINNAL
jgi:vitamin B12 transporter